MTTKRQIIYYLQTHSGWNTGSALEAQSQNFQTKSSVISRRCRDLVSDGKIERRINERGAVEYRLKREMSADQANDFLKKLEQEKQGALL